MIDLPYLFDSTSVRAGTFHVLAIFLSFHLVQNN